MQTRSVPTPPRAAKPPTEPSWLAHSLADKTTLLRLSVIANVALVLWSLIQPHIVIQQLHAPQRAIVLDGAGSYTISPLLNIDEAEILFQHAAQDAALAFLNKNPNGLDRPSQVELWFTKTGRDKVDALVKAEAAEFTAKQFFQKCVLDPETKAIATGDGRFTAHLTGQLIRTGTLNGRIHVETKTFQLDLPMVRNPDMLTNKRYPYAAWEFDLQYSL